MPKARVFMGDVGSILLLVYPLGWQIMISCELAFGIYWCIVMLRVRKQVEGAAK